VTPEQAPSPKHKQFECSGCGAVMAFDPHEGLLKCTHCGHTQPVPAPPSTAISSHGLDEFMARAGDSHLTPLTGEALQAQCTGCGSVVHFEPPEVAGACPFCGANIVDQPKAADPLVAPDAVLPFRVERDQALTQVRQWLQSRWFAPNALKRVARQDGINGVYLPFWTYDSDTVSNYSGARGEHYYETESYTDSEGRTQTREVMRTAWYPVSGQVSRSFQNVLVPASKSVAEKKLDALEPWDLEDLNPYEPAYLAGFKAQRYQLELPEGFEHAKRVMAQQIDRDVRSDIGGDEQQVNQVDTAYLNSLFRHLLLPCWVGAYRFRGDLFQIVVNARTGEVQGERPYSAWKIAFLVLAVIAAILLISLLAHR
jgi:predicted RNA-binding Zn-ribbon protein involved in translation (DUF1610 family)